MVNVNERVRRHRVGLRAAGLRSIQIWVPDTRRPGFVEKCRRQCRLVQDDPQEREVLDWLNDAADTETWKWD